MDNYIWLIGAGRLQEPMVKEIKSRGYQILATDRDPKAWCKHLVDKLVTIDTYDIAEHIAYANKLKTDPVAILTDAADVGPTVSALAEYYSLPACNLQAATKTRNKSTMRVALDLEHPVFTVNKANDVYSSEAWFRWLKTARYNDISYLPCVVKSCDNCASRGVTLVNNINQFEIAYENAIRNNHLVDTVLIEEKLTGTEVAVDWFVTENGKVIYVNGALRKFDQFGIEVGHINPAFGIVPDKIQQLAEHAVKKLGVTGGPFKTDLLYDDRYGWCILECATRWSGGYDHGWSAKHATGRNLEKPLLDYALGLPLDEQDFEHKEVDKFCAVYAPRLTCEINYDLLTRIKNQPNVVDVVWNEKQPTGTWSSCAEREVFVMTTGYNDETVWQNAVDAVNNSIN